MNLLLQLYTPSKCQIYNKWTVHEHKCLSPFLFFRFPSNWEREREWYIKFGYKEKWSQNYLSYFSTGFHWRIFLLLRANRLSAIFNTGLKKMASSCLADIFSSSSPGVLGFWFCLLRTMSQNWLSYYLFPLTGRSPHFRFGVPANHLASLSFPLARRSIWATICHPSLILFPSGHPVQTSVFPFWPGFVTLGLTYILSCLNGHSLIRTQGIVFILFLSSPWDITWQYPFFQGSSVGSVHSSL